MSGQLEVELRRFFKSLLLEVWEEICKSEAVKTTPCEAPRGPATPHLLKSRETAEVLGVSEKTLWSLTKEAVIPCVRLGRLVRYDMDAVRVAIANLSSEGTTQAGGHREAGERACVNP